jgi:uncharacterized protein (TIGR02678 family)
MSDLDLSAERRAAARLLLVNPLVTPTSHPEVFPLIRRHAEELSRRFTQNLGYRLVVEPGFARLHKAGLGRSSGRRLERVPSRIPFTPRTYAYLALILSTLVTAPEQLLLSELIARTQAAAAEAGIELGDPGRAAERRTLVAALRQLSIWHVLIEEEGSVDALAESSEAEALLTIDREIARNLVGGPVGVSASADDLIERAAEAGSGGPRHAVRRRLIETPVVYLGDLDEEQVDWLRRNQRREQRIYEETFGLDSEIRAEGVALLDPDEELTDLTFPGTGTVAQAALLLLERLSASGEAGSERHVDALLTELVAAHGRAWSKELREDLTGLRAAVLDLLTRMSLIWQGPDGRWEATPIAARYAPEVFNR